jgi:hypothetical protein
LEESVLNLEGVTREEYLRLADEAELRAANAPTEVVRDNWRTIAMCYRELAQALPSEK